MEDEPDRSLLEIKHLLLKLNPKIQHKDRVRSLARFRNYASGDHSKKSRSENFSTPDFYDDDVPLLLLGSYQSTVAGADQGATSPDELNQYHGLLTACAHPSKTTAGALKRSARNAMSLLKYLSLEYVEVKDGEPVPVDLDPSTGLPELNPFAYALCGLSVSLLRLANWETHLRTDDKNRKHGAAKDDACEVLLLLLTRHFDPLSDVGTVVGTDQRSPPKPIVIEELLPDAKARQSFENWLVLNKSRDVVGRIRDKFLHRSSADPSPSSAADKAAATPKRGPSDPIQNPFGDDDSTDEPPVVDPFAKRRRGGTAQIAEAEAQAHADEQLDRLGLDLYENKNDPAAVGDGADRGGPATT